MRMKRLLLTVALLLAGMALVAGCRKQNHPPDTPATPSGPASAHVDSVLTFTSSATDPDGDSVAIRFAWGDGDTSGWSGLVTSGASMSHTHAWAVTGTYLVCAQAKDASELRTAWSMPCTVRVTGGWARTFGRTGWDEGYSVQQTADSGYIIVGETECYGAGDCDVWLVKTAAAGNLVWSRTFGGTSWDVGNSVQQTTDGGYIIVGVTYGTGWGDVWLVKTDAAGNLAWASTFGGTGWDEGYSVQQTIDGGYIIAGVTSSFGAGNEDVWLVKTDAAGNLVWSRTFGGAHGDWAKSVVQTSDGGYAIVGVSHPAGLDADIWLLKTDAAGDTVWTKSIPAGWGGEGNSVRPAADGGYIITGRTGFGQNGDVCLIKTGPSGGTEWTRQFGGDWLDVGCSAQATLDGGCIVVGTTSSFGAGGEDVWLLKTDAAGDTAWARTFGGASSDGGNSVQQTTDGGYIIAGVGDGDVLLIKTDADGNTVMSSMPGRGTEFGLGRGGRQGSTGFPGQLPYIGR
jgi:hypothetical protein